MYHMYRYRILVLEHAVLTALCMTLDCKGMSGYLTVDRSLILDRRCWGQPSTISPSAGFMTL